MTTVFHAHTDAAATSLALAEFVATQLAQAVAARGKASLVVSGGRSPIAFFGLLAQKPLPWESIVVLLADERCVPEDHDDSNTWLVRTHLLVGHARTARFVSMSPAEAPEIAAATASANLAAAPMPFDIVVLGMGEDGHTASLFPDSPQLASALDAAAPRVFVPVTTSNGKHARLTLTANALTESRRFALLIAGAGKRTVYERALAPGPVAEFPIRLALHHPSVPCHVFWNP